METMGLLRSYAHLAASCHLGQLWNLGIASFSPLWLYFSPIQTDTCDMRVEEELKFQSRLSSVPSDFQKLQQISGTENWPIFFSGGGVGLMKKQTQTEFINVTNQEVKERLNLMD